MTLAPELLAKWKTPRIWAPRAVIACTTKKLWWVWFLRSLQDGYGQEQQNKRTKCELRLIPLYPKRYHEPSFRRLFERRILACCLSLDFSAVRDLTVTFFLSFPKRTRKVNNNSRIKVSLIYLLKFEYISLVSRSNRAYRVSRAACLNILPWGRGC